MLGNGWIRLDRKITKWDWYDDINTTRLFIHLLLTCNYEKKKWHGIMLEPGQKVTGRKKLAEEIGLSEQQIRTCISNLQSTSNLTIQSTNKYSIVTICNYSAFQQKPNGGQPANQPTNTPISNQQSTTMKQYKQINNKQKELYNNFSLDYYYEKVPKIFNGAIELSPQTPRVLTINNTIRKSIKSRLKDKSFKNLKSWRLYFEWAMKSKFLTENSWADFNWLTKEENIQKVRAGNYHQGLPQPEEEYK